VSQLSTRTLRPHDATDNNVSTLVPVDQLPSGVDRQHFNDLGTICVFVLRCRSKDVEQPTSTTSSEVDDAAAETSEPTSEMPDADSAPGSTENDSEADASESAEAEHECEHEYEPESEPAESEPAESEPAESETAESETAESEPAESEPAESEPDMLLGLMNDGASDNSRFGLDGERPGPAEQKAWSWNTPYPPPQAGHGPPMGHVPGQPPSAQNGPYGSYAFPSALPQNWQSGPGMSQDQSTAQRPQRRVHFNDQIPPQPPRYGTSGHPYVGQSPTDSVGQSQEKSHQAPGRQYSGPNANTNVGQPQETGYTHHPPGQTFRRQDPNISAGQSQQGGYSQQPSAHPTFGQPVQQGQPYGWPGSSPNVGQPQENSYAQQSSGYPESGDSYSGHTLNTNVAQAQQGEPAQQPGHYGHPSQTQNHHQVPAHGAVHGSHAYAPSAYGGMPPQGQVQNFSLVPDLSYQPPLPPNVPPVPSYQPIGYGAPEYAGWPMAANYAGYAQPAWPGQMPGPSCMIPSNLAPTYHHSHSYPYSQSAYPGGSVVPAPHLVTSHAGGGIWGPPPGTQDPTKDENHQLDGQANQNQNNSGGQFGQSNDNNAQGWVNDDTTKTQATDSNWDNNNAGESQTGNWNNTSNQTEAPTQEWNATENKTGQTNNADSSWNNNANASTQGHGSWSNNVNTNSQGQDQDNTQGQDTWNTNDNTTSQGQDTWNTNANANMQNQESWNATAAIAQANNAAITPPKRDFTAASPAQERLLHGPHGPYYGRNHGTQSHQSQSPDNDVEMMLQPVVGEEPPYDVPADMPTTHQVKRGPGYMYHHKRRSPEYLDTLEEPFARFVFKYRTRSKFISFIDPPSPKCINCPACFSSWCNHLQQMWQPHCDEHLPRYNL
jgi:hypothetical protein